MQRANQVLDDPYGDKTLNNWFNPAAFAQPALGTYGNSGRNAYEGPGTRVVDLSLVRSFRFADIAPHRGARRGVQRVQLVPPGAARRDRDDGGQRHVAGD